MINNTNTHTGRRWLSWALCALVLSGSFCTPAAKVPTNSSKPYNVIYILTDDLGYSELGSYGNTFNETPHLDKMAAEGVRFTNCYASAPVCSPYRAALMTGKYPARLGITDYLRPNASQHLDTAEITLAEMFRSNGYRTGIIGKWHLSGYVKAGATEVTPPDMHGFDEVIVSENEGIAEGTYFHPYHFNKDIQQKLPGEKEYITDRQNQEALEFIDRHKEQPFFLYLSHYAVHTTLHGKPGLVEHFREKAGAGTSAPSKNNPQNDPYKKWPADYKALTNNPHLAAQLYVIDQGVGALMDKLKQLGIDKNTIVIFTSDNGGEINVTSNAPLRGGKSMLYEGGVREPLLVWNPVLFPQAAVCTTPVANYDFYPTLMELTGARPNSQKTDGVSIASLLKNPASALAERTFYWHYPLDKPHFLGGRSSGSIRKGDWKLIEFFDDGHKELYNLKDDPGEKTDLVQRSPAKVAELEKDLAEWRKSVGAQQETAKANSPQ
jgi:arylsulfatase A